MNREIITMDDARAFVTAMDAEAKLKPGDKVIARWTNSGYHFQCPAAVVRLNDKSVRVTLDKEILKYTAPTEVLYPAGQSIIVPRMTSTSWTINNCAIIPKKE